MKQWHVIGVSWTDDCQPIYTLLALCDNKEQARLNADLQRNYYGWKLVEIYRYNESPLIIS